VRKTEKLPMTRKSNSAEVQKLHPTHENQDSQSGQKIVNDNKSPACGGNVFRGPSAIFLLHSFELFFSHEEGSNRRHEILFKSENLNVFIYFQALFR
jgi:hypothetical protein